MLSDIFPADLVQSAKPARQNTRAERQTLSMLPAIGPRNDDWGWRRLPMERQ
jgi:hypothetical protein